MALNEKIKNSQAPDFKLSKPKYLNLFDEIHKSIDFDINGNRSVV